MSLQTVLTVPDMRRMVANWHQKGYRVGFVPTMGALHDGHLKLVQEAKDHCDHVIVSIFVNPLQFGPKEDFARYPRTLSADVEKLETVGADAVFAPNASEIYPDGFQTSVVNKEMARGLCGPFRPGHFDGVLTVVLKLLQIVNPNVAIFGKKDYQQWRLIERMAVDLCLNCEVIGSETLRESDGLAMSSRNRYLAADQREQSALIYKGLSAAKASYDKGERSKEAILARFHEKILLCPAMKVQYADLVKAIDLSATSETLGDELFVLAVSVYYGDVRLIDNLEFGGQR